MPRDRRRPAGQPRRPEASGPSQGFSPSVAPPKGTPGCYKNADSKGDAFWERRAQFGTNTLDVWGTGMLARMMPAQTGRGRVTPAPSVLSMLLRGPGAACLPYGAAAVAGREV